MLFSRKKEALFAALNNASEEDILAIVEQCDQRIANVIDRLHNEYIDLCKSFTPQQYDVWLQTLADLKNLPYPSLFAGVVMLDSHDVETITSYIIKRYPNLARPVVLIMNMAMKRGGRSEGNA